MAVICHRSFLILLKDSNKNKAATIVVGLLYAQMYNGKFLFNNKGVINEIVTTKLVTDKYIVKSFFLDKIAHFGEYIFTYLANKYNPIKNSVL